MKTVLGIFEYNEDATAAIDHLKDEGYSPEDISIMVRDKDTREDIANDTGVNAPVQGAVSGAATGAILGGLAGLAAAVFIPGLGAFFIGGPLAAALGLGGAAATTVSGAATGAVAGGLIGALTSLGLSEQEARIYEDRVSGGAILVAVPARRGEEWDVEEILSDNNATDVKTVGSEVEDREILERRHPHRTHAPMFAGLKGGRGRRG